MLKNIKLHIDEEDSVQEEQEMAMAKRIAEIHSRNINAFQRLMPNLLPLVELTSSKNISVFCNKSGEINLVDYGQGRTFYGFHPEKEVLAHIQRFAEHALYIDINVEVAPTSDKDKDKDKDKDPLSKNDEDIKAFKQLNSWHLKHNAPTLPKSIKCLVILGCGLGYHIRYLIQNYAIEHLIIYEPEAQYFQCSTKVIDWSDIFKVAKSKGTAIYLQIGKDGRDILEDIAQLQNIVEFSGFYIYQHYHHPIFQSVINSVQYKSWWFLQKQGISFKLEIDYLDYLPAWTPNSVTESHADVDLSSQRYQENLAALKKFFPDIYSEFKDYKPAKWLPVQASNNEINILKKDNLACWYGDSPKRECEMHYDSFSLHPNKDGLILGYNGKKLRHYMHYKFVAETEKLLKEVEEVEGSLPQTIKSIIIFGLASGYQLEVLLEKHTVENLFICEPNRDFFHASLFAIPWASILAEINAQGNRLYLNIGDDGSNLMQDLLQQFYSVGPYILNNTYFYQTYFNANLNTAIAQLREQLQVIISMGEYFDHAWYGINQTRDVISQGTPALVKAPDTKLSYDEKEVPIFLVGNGPSIDVAIEYLHEYRDQVILVSCGTVLKVLHKNNLTPDFHLEIEQNRTTFDWAVLIDDLDYLKQISLISCNGIHPDTCSLYKETFVAFKEGESSTVSSLEILGEEKFEPLKFAFPTVANLAINMFSKLGFHNIYLVGIDLGFVDKTHHHSRSSSYYDEKGIELYDYGENNNISLMVAGNFRPVVNTKHEFKISRIIIEQTLALNGKDKTVYNTSDGAKIAGTFPLRIENLLITVDQKLRNDALQAIKCSAFEKIDGPKYLEDFAAKFRTEKTAEALERLLKLLEKPPENALEADKFIEKQKLTLFACYERGDNLLFYLLYGTSNYANAFLSKLINNYGEKVELSEHFYAGLKQWKKVLIKIKEMILLNHNLYDGSSFNQHKRQIIRVKQLSKNKTVLVVTNSLAFARSWQYIINEEQKHTFNCTICNPRSIPEGQFDVVVHHSVPELEQSLNTLSCIKQSEGIKRGRQNTFVMIYDDETELVAGLQSHPSDINFVSIIRHLPESGEEEQWCAHAFWIAHFCFRILFDNNQSKLYLPKYFMRKGSDPETFENAKCYEPEETHSIEDFSYHSIVSFGEQRNQSDISCSGERGKFLLKSEFPVFYKKRCYGVVDSETLDKTIAIHESYVPEIRQDRYLDEVMEFRFANQDQ